MNRFTQLANPNRFMHWSTLLLPWCAAATILTLLVGLVWALKFSPDDYQQGDTVRIMYIHVPAAWMCMMVYTVMAISSAVYLIWRHMLAHVIASSSALIGATFTVICLVTGALWGQPMWGTWWVWDARLTSVLILLFLYIGYMAVDGSFEDEDRGRFASAVLALIGFVNIPIIKFSVDWWNTLHQPASILRMDGPTIHESMLWPLLVMIVGFKLLYVTLLILRAQRKILLYKIRRLQYVNDPS